MNPTAGTSTINYTLTRTQPAISADQPIWVFVKYRLSTDTDFTGWQDTDDHNATNDNSDGRFTGNDDNSKNQCDAGYPCTVNDNLADDVGIVTSGGSKQIPWTWGTTGTGLSSADSVRVRVYAVEMVLVPDGGSMTFGTDGSAQDRITTAGAGNDYDPSSAYYLMKYPCTAEMYAAFLNCCVNRHDGSDYDYDFYNVNMTDEDTHDRLDMTGSIGTDAAFTANSNQEDYAMTYVDWWNAYDWAKWAGLRMPTEEEFEYEASNVAKPNPAANWDFPWGDDAPTADGGGNVRCNMDGVSPDNASDVRTYDEGAAEANRGLSAHNAAEMSGNVFEWEFTRWYTGGYQSNNSTEAQAGYGNGSVRVVRGGNWSSYATRMRSASRYGYHPRSYPHYKPSRRGSDLGFRAARTQ